MYILCIMCSTSCTFYHTGFINAWDQCTGFIENIEKDKQASEKMVIISITTWHGIG